MLSPHLRVRPPRPTPHTAVGWCANRRAPRYPTRVARPLAPRRRIRPAPAPVPPHRGDRLDGHASGQVKRVNPYISQLERRLKSPTRRVILTLFRALKASASKLVATVERDLSTCQNQNDSYRSVVGRPVAFVIAVTFGCSNFGGPFRREKHAKPCHGSPHTPG